MKRERSEEEEASPANRLIPGYTSSSSHDYASEPYLADPWEVKQRQNRWRRQRGLSVSDDEPEDEDNPRRRYRDKYTGRVVELTMSQWLSGFNSSRYRLVADHEPLGLPASSSPSFAASDDDDVPPTQLL